MFFDFVELVRIESLFILELVIDLVELVGIESLFLDLVIRFDLEIELVIRELELLAASELVVYSYSEIESDLEIEAPKKTFPWLVPMVTELRRHRLVIRSFSLNRRHHRQVLKPD